MTKKRPIQNIRRGYVEAAIWKNDTDNGPMYNVTFKEQAKLLEAQREFEAEQERQQRIVEAKARDDARRKEQEQIRALIEQKSWSTFAEFTARLDELESAPRGKRRAQVFIQQNWPILAGPIPDTAFHDPSNRYWRQSKKWKHNQSPLWSHELAVKFCFDGDAQANLFLHWATIENADRDFKVDSQTWRRAFGLVKDSIADTLQEYPHAFANASDQLDSVPLNDPVQASYSISKAYPATVIQTFQWSGRIAGTERMPPYIRLARQNADPDNPFGPTDPLIRMLVDYVAPTGGSDDPFILGQTTERNPFDD